MSTAIRLVVLAAATLYLGKKASDAIKKANAIQERATLMEKTEEEFSYSRRLLSYTMARMSYPDIANRTDNQQLIFTSKHRMHDFVELRYRKEAITRRNNTNMSDGVAVGLLVSPTSMQAFLLMPGTRIEVNQFVIAETEYKVFEIIYRQHGVAVNKAAMLYIK